MAEINSGSITLFKQTTPPTGWTKLTAVNDYTLRVVSGTVGTGGTKSFSSTFSPTIPTGSIGGSGTTGATALTSAELPSHNHSYTYIAAPIWPTTTGVNLASPAGSAWAVTSPRSSSFSYNMTNVGSNGTHSHPISISVSSPGFTGSELNLDLKYVDMILAQRD